MKSKLKKSDYEKIYAMLDAVSPLPCDCGRLCGSACCMAAMTVKVCETRKDTDRKKNIKDIR